MEQKKMIAIIVAAIAIIALIAAAVLLTSGNGSKGGEDTGDVSVTGITLNKTTVTLKPGASETITATVLPSNATNKNVTWSTSAPGVATVSGGRIIAVADGTATITAKTADGGLTANCIVTVKSDAPPVPTVSNLDDAVLKVLGNVNGDVKIDADDVKLIQGLIAAKAKVSDANKIADANNDGSIDQKDVDVVNKIIARQSTPIWHINYFDQDGNGTMDSILEKTEFPITSFIMTGSSNSFMLLWMLGVTEEVKGACYSSTVDTYFKNYYLDTSKVEKIGTSSTTLPFENGKVGTSNIIAEKNVTAVFTDWNQTYITNWQSYENSNIDVVRVSAAAVETDVFAHGALLCGLLFGKVDRSIELVNFYNEAYSQIEDKLASVSEAQKPGFIASSMTGYVSVGNSDYNKVGLMAAGKYALENYQSTSTSVKIVDNPQFYNPLMYSYDYILHLRTGNYYADEVNVDKVWNDYTSAFGDWEKGTDGQYIICGGMPVPMRVAYAAAVMHPDLVSVDWANDLHQQLVDKFFNGDKLNIAAMNFIIHKGAEETSTATLMIMGNANGDDVIDSKDVSIINAIIGGSKAFADFPMADANNDGKVDSKDVELVNSMIKKESGTVYVRCLDVNGDDTVVAVKYPLRNVVTYATNMQVPTLFANGGQYVAGYFSKSYDVAEASLKDAVDLKGSARTITDAAWANFTALDASLASSGGIGAVLVDHSGIAQFTEARMADLKASGIPMIDYTSADAVDELQTVLTLGFLFGGDCEKVGRDYAKIGWEVKDKVQEEVSKLADKDKVSYICGTMYIYVCGPDSSFNSTAATAGGIPYASLNSEFASKYTKNSTKMTSTEALSNYTDAGIIINNRSMDWGLTADEEKSEIISTWDHDNSGVSSREYFKDFEDRLVYVNNLLPGGVKIAYMAHAMYGDLFSMEWADGVLQKYIDLGSEPLKGQTLDSVLAYITFDDYKAAAGI
ncbi:MAG: Ig-like domain-containing protein [Candidatus Methanomethylophilaceae archaeon]|nr:Ig-like domain-containing protein [Candidatus Methanomethylophilaceae archaeon]